MKALSCVERILKTSLSGELSEEVVIAAREHCVSALVYDALRSYTPSGAAEEKALERLKMYRLEILAKNSFYEKELMLVLRSFAKNNIPAIPLKGIILSEHLYGDIYSRDSSIDVDLLVREEDVARSRAALEDIGYTFRPGGEIKKYEWCHVFAKPRSQMVEAHWDITMTVRSRERIEGLWRGAVPVDRGDVRYYYFKPEELLLYLSAHLINSGAFRQLRHIRDIERLIEKYGNEIDWNSVVRKAREWRLSGSLYAALILIRQFSGLIFPAKIPRELKISLPKRLFIRFFADKKVVAGSGFRRRFLDAFLSYIFFEIVEAASFKDHLHIFKRIFFPPRDSIADAGYCRRTFKGAVKLTKRVLC